MEIVRKLALCASAMVAGSATAAETGFYFGVFGGQSRYAFEQPEFVPPVAVFSPTPDFRPLPDDVYLSPGGVIGGFNVASPFAFSSLSWPDDADDDATAWGLLAGYRIVRYAAVEVSYLDLGTLENTETLVLGFPPFTSSVDFREEVQTTGPSISGLGILPITDQWDVYLRAGVLFADMELTSSFVDSTSSITFGSESLLWGAGTQFNWGEHWSVRLDFQRFESAGDDSGIGEADIDLLSLGILFRL